jgi:hypothetical protein
MKVRTIGMTIALAGGAAVIALGTAGPALATPSSGGSSVGGAGTNAISQVGTAVSNAQTQVGTAGTNAISQTGTAISNGQQQTGTAGTNAISQVGTGLGNLLGHL